MYTRVVEIKRIGLYEWRFCQKIYFEAQHIIRFKYLYPVHRNPDALQKGMRNGYGRIMCKKVALQDYQDTRRFEV